MKKNKSNKKGEIEGEITKYRDCFQKSSSCLDARIEDEDVTLSVIAWERHVNNSAIFFVSVQANLPQFDVLANLFDWHFHCFTGTYHTQRADVRVEAKLGT